MTSKRVNQSVTRVVSFYVNTVANPIVNSAVVQLNVPFAVDEIRVSQAFVVIESLIARPVTGYALVISSPDLLQGAGNDLAIIQAITVSYTTAHLPVSGTAMPISNRFVFPPSHKRNINGSYTLIARHFEDLSLSTKPPFSVILLFEFIQYEPEMKIPVEPDLQQIAKSGRRRL